MLVWYNSFAMLKHPQYFPSLDKHIQIGAHTCIVHKYVKKWQVGSAEDASMANN